MPADFTIKGIEGVLARFDRRSDSVDRIPEQAQQPGCILASVEVAGQ
jgi:hypothetical protein